MPSCGSVLCALILPPLGVCLHERADCCNSRVWLCISLTLLGYLPGVIYALCVIYGRCSCRHQQPPTVVVVQDQPPPAYTAQGHQQHAPVFLHSPVEAQQPSVFTVQHHHHHQHTASAVDTDETEKRLERIERCLRSAAAIIWNFPITDYPLTHRKDDRSMAVRDFLEDAFGLSEEETDRLNFRSIEVIPTQTSSNDVANVRIDFVNQQGKDLCWRNVKHLSSFNQYRPRGEKVKWSNDLTPAQREARKKRLQSKARNKDLRAAPQQWGRGGGARRSRR